VGVCFLPIGDEYTYPGALLCLCYTLVAVEDSVEQLHHRDGEILPKRANQNQNCIECSTGVESAAEVFGKETGKYTPRNRP
jgi:hypothetical protein